MLTTAAALYQQSASIWGDMQKDGTLSNPDGLRLERLNRQIAKKIMMP